MSAAAQKLPPLPATLEDLLVCRAEHILHLRAFLRAGRWDQLVEMTLRHQVTLYAGTSI